MDLLLSKDIWDESNPIPCLRIAFLGECVDGTIYVDWEKWCDWCNLSKNDPFTDWRIFARTVDGKPDSIDYEESMRNCPKWVVLDFLGWAK